MEEQQKHMILSSQEEPTDEMLYALMEGIASAARESSMRAEAEKRRRLRWVAHEIKSWRLNQKT